MLELSQELDLTHTPIKNKKFEKIKIDERSTSRFSVCFSPIDLFENTATFESAVSSFVKENGTKIEGITIGSAKWRNFGQFRLSHSFYLSIVQSLPYLRKLMVYNIADRGSFILFLNVHKTSMQLKEVTFIQPKNNGKPDPQPCMITVLL